MFTYPGGFDPSAFSEPFSSAYRTHLQHLKLTGLQPKTMELEEAAAIEGCGPFQIFTKVILPLMGPGLAAASIFTFRIAWKEFILALVLTVLQTCTLAVAASMFITDLGVDWG